MANDRFYMKGTALKPGAALALFERLMGRPAPCRSAWRSPRRCSAGRII